VPVAVALLSFAKPAAAYTIGVADGLTKIRSDQPPPANLAQSAIISAAQNEFEPFQIVMTGPATGVNARAGDLSRVGGGFTIAAANITLYREEYIQVTTPSSGNPESVVGWWPDPLIPAIDEVYNEPRNAFPFSVPTVVQDSTHQTRAIWVDVFVPQSALPGDYTGSVALTFAETSASITVPIQLHVWNFQLPSTPHLKTHFRLTYPNLCYGHGVTAGSTTWAQLDAAYIQLALDHRISIPNADYGGPGTGSDTYSKFQDLIVGTSQPPPRRPLRLQGAHLTWIEVLNTGTQAGIQEWWNTFGASALQPFQSALNVYLCDEPDNNLPGQTWADCVSRSGRARAVSANLHTFLTADWSQATTSSRAISAGFSPSMTDIFVPLVDHLWAPSPPYQGNPSPPPYGRMGDYANWLAQNVSMRSVMDYQSCDSIGCGGRASGWPNYSIDANPVQNRASPWLSFIFGTSGEFYYETADTYTPNTQTGSVGDPWRSPFAHGGFGEGTLFYPGVSNTAGRSWAPCNNPSPFSPNTPSIGGNPQAPHDIAVPSIRLKMIREGIEDYEYLTACKAAGAGAVAKALSVFPNAYSTDASAATLLQARKDLAACIEPSEMMILVRTAAGQLVPVVF
jgi:hypothetical protein